MLGLRQGRRKGKDERKDQGEKGSREGEEGSTGKEDQVKEGEGPKI